MLTNQGDYNKEIVEAKCMHDEFAHVELYYALAACTQWDTNKNSVLWWKSWHTLTQQTRRVSKATEAIDPLTAATIGGSFRRLVGGSIGGPSTIFATEGLLYCELVVENSRKWIL